eukprot:scaffold1800_cov332-Pavlova_lutheri.AAC.16
MHRFPSPVSWHSFPLLPLASLDRGILRRGIECEPFCRLSTFTHEDLMGTLFMSKEDSMGRPTKTRDELWGDAPPYGTLEDEGHSSQRSGAPDPMRRSGKRGPDSSAVIAKESPAHLPSRSIPRRGSSGRSSGDPLRVTLAWTIRIVPHGPTRVCLDRPCLHPSSHHPPACWAFSNFILHPPDCHPDRTRGVPFPTLPFVPDGTGFPTRIHPPQAPPSRLQLFATTIPHVWDVLAAILPP